MVHPKSVRGMEIHFIIGRLRGHVDKERLDTYDVRLKAGLLNDREEARIRELEGKLVANTAGRRR